MNRLIISAVLALSPAAHAQQTGDRVEGEKLAAAFSQTDLDTLGACQAWIEAVGIILGNTEAWLVAQNQTDALSGLRKQQEGGAGLLDSFADIRQRASKAKGMKLATSDKAREDILAILTRRDGEDERAYYTRTQPQTRLPADCREALKRGRWKVEIDGLGHE